MPTAPIALTTPITHRDSTTWATRASPAIGGRSSPITASRIRLAVIGDERPPIAGLARVAQVVESRCVIGVVSAIGAVGIDHQAGFVEESSGRLVLERLDGGVKNAPEES